MFYKLSSLFLGNESKIFLKFSLEKIVYEFIILRQLRQINKEKELL